MSDSTKAGPPREVEDSQSVSFPSEIDEVSAFVADQEQAAHPLSEERGKAYWHANLKLMGGLLAIWFLVSFGFGILLVEPLNAIALAGFKLGFWFAQQGAIYVFVVLIFVYVWRMHKIDEAYAVEDDETRDDVRTIGN